MRNELNNKLKNELKNDLNNAFSFGIGAEIISGKAVKDLIPSMRTEDLIGALYVPSDGVINPADVCMALGKWAKHDGAQIAEGMEVTGFDIRHGEIAAVHTTKGLVRADLVVNAAGLWGHNVGALCGMQIPAVNVEHQYAVFDPNPEWESDWKTMPTIRDPEFTLYYKPEPSGKMIVGGWEKGTVPVFGTGLLPMSFGPELFSENMDRFETHAHGAMHLFPGLEDVGLSAMINGPIPMTPDGNPIIGWAPALQNMFVVTGFIAGIGSAGGVGEFVAKWMLEGRSGPAPVQDVREEEELQMFAPERFPAMSAEEAAVEAVRVYGSYYDIDGTATQAKMNE